jgi:hypothetical protein
MVIYLSELAGLLATYSATSLLLVLVLQMIEIKFRRKMKVLSFRTTLCYLGTVLLGGLGGSFLWQIIPELGPLFANPHKIVIPYFFPAAFLAAATVAAFGSTLILRVK